MSFKENLPQSALPSLSGFGILELGGADAEAFAQAQFMSDVRALAPGRWQWSGWLNPKGRVIALFALLRLAPGRLWLVLPDAAPAPLRERLQRFVFRSKVVLREVTSHRAAAQRLGVAPAADPALAGGNADDGCWLDWSGEGGSRRLWLLPEGSELLATGTPGEDGRWFAADLAHGLPRLGAGQAEAWTPQMLSLERLSAFSLKKGCYPGQEIVARTHYLGQAKRGLLRLLGPGLAAGLALEADGQALGTVVCAAGTEALAVAAPLPAHASLATAAGPCRAAPLLEGLARAG